jgi:spore germination cell wall hydrolase CwlJ-like protein
VTGLYHFNPQGSYSPFVKLGWHHWSFKNKENVSASGNHEFYGVGAFSEKGKWKIADENNQ